MDGDYDAKSISCNICRWYERKNGNESCTYWGYRLHPELGVSLEPCPSLMTDAQYAQAQRLEMKTKKKRSKG